MPGIINHRELNSAPQRHIAPEQVSGAASCVARRATPVFADVNLSPTRLVGVVAGRVAVRESIQRQLGKVPALFIGPGAEPIRTLQNEGVDAIVVDCQERDWNRMPLPDRNIGDNAPPVIGYCRQGKDLGRIARLAVSAGLAELVVEGLDDLQEAIERSITTSIDCSCVGHVWALIEGVTPSELRRSVHMFIFRAADGFNISRVAAELGIDRRSLVDEYDAADWPSPSVVMGWCRLLIAVRMLALPRHSISDVALKVGYASVNRLRELPKRLVGVTLAEAVELGSGRLSTFLLGMLPGRPGHLAFSRPAVATNPASIAIQPSERS